MSDCRKCTDFEWCNEHEECGLFKPKKMTNADRIRTMTDEELAEFMCHNVSNGTINCAFCAAEEFCHMGHNGWLGWLKQEEAPSD